MTSPAGRLREVPVGRRVWPLGARCLSVASPAQLPSQALLLAAQCAALTITGLLD